MRPESSFATLEDRAAALNAQFADASAVDILAHVLGDMPFGRTALVSSFGADSIVLLNMVAGIDRSTPVIFVDTEMLFAETLAYQEDVAKGLGFSALRRIRPDRGDLIAADNEGLLHLYDTDTCCDIRKVRPLQKALAGLETWITGRRRSQGGDRSLLQVFEVADGRLKVNPLVAWSPEQVRDYIADNDLPRHPLVAKGYASLGCAPCTTRVADGEDPRAGRWRNAPKTECGIHFPAAGAGDAS